MSTDRQGRSELGLLCAFIQITSPAIAWEATRPSGWMPNRAGQKKLSAPQDIPFDANFEQRTVAYPHRQGVSLGQGWDFITNEKKPSGCIRFNTEYDSYQDATINLEQAYDLESLDVTLNLDIKGEAKAAGGLLKAGGETKLDGSHSNKSSDTVVVAHASVVKPRAPVRVSGRMNKKLR